MCTVLAGIITRLAGLRRELGAGVDAGHEEQLGTLLADAALDPDLHAVALLEPPADVQPRLLEHLRLAGCDVNDGQVCVTGPVLPLFHLVADPLSRLDTEICRRGGLRSTS